ncbi:MAG: ECF transporter S component [Ruminococcaceae bacterium]|nr:ECF transporter S component [Oscillospiraceae bacterium]
MSQTKQKTIFNVNYLVKVAILGAVARVVMLLEFPLPFFPSFLQLDFSDLVPLMGSFAMGPLAGVLIQLVKCLLHLVTGGIGATGGVGDLANFIVGAAFVGAAGLYYKYHKTKSGAVISLLLGSLTMIVAGGIVNYFITIPLYGLAMDWSEEMILGMSSDVIPAIKDRFTLILYAFCPFNLLKSVILVIITLPVYKPLVTALRSIHKT